MSAAATRPLRRTTHLAGWYGDAVRDWPDRWLAAEVEDHLRERAGYLEEVTTGIFTGDATMESTTNSIEALDRALERLEREWSRRRRLEQYGGPHAPDPRSVSLDDRFARVRRLDIVDVITTIAEVWFSGPDRRGEYLARCPFPDHDDRDPSFTANADKGLFHCFGCQRGGEVIEFARQWFGCLSRPEALEHLEHELGLQGVAA